jgi:predicted  nucleic acid-binding Zn-ribbon protein
MKTSTFLQLFLLFDVFLMGAIGATALRHAFAHFKPQEHDLEKAHKPIQNGHLPPAVREKLLEDAQANFQNVLDRAASELQKDLESTASQIKKRVEKLGNEAAGDELEHYQTTISELQKQTENELGVMDKELAEREAELRKELTDQEAALKAKLDTEMTAEKQSLIQQIDTKLADAVASFLLETLQHNVDLGAQSAYLTAMLEEHKADFTKELADEAKA